MLQRFENYSTNIVPDYTRHGVSKKFVFAPLLPALFKTLSDLTAGCQLFQNPMLPLHVYKKQIPSCGGDRLYKALGYNFKISFHGRTPWLSWIWRLSKGYIGF
jgi:hypothetical protein